MTTTKSKPTGGITPFQIKRIMNNCNYNMDIKDEWVQWATGDMNRTSLRTITHDQAVKIMRQQTGESPITPEGGTLQDSSPFGGWGAFNKSNPKHLLILSLVRQAQWTVSNEKHGEVADLNRLSSWLKSERSPVNKPLLKMDAHEIERIIAALSGIVKSIFK